MTTPPDHLVYLQQKDYSPSYRELFTDEEAANLVRFGHWMQALVEGTIAPVTAEQRHFVQVARWEAEPQSALEHVWR